MEGRVVDPAFLFAPAWVGRTAAIHVNRRSKYGRAAGVEWLSYAGLFGFTYPFTVPAIGVFCRVQAVSKRYFSQPSFIYAKNDFGAHHNDGVGQ